MLPHLLHQGHTRTGVLGLRGPADWDAVLGVWQSVQADAGMPAPAIAVNGADAYLLWFSLQTPVPLVVMDGFLAALQASHWPEVAPQRVLRWPAPVQGTAQTLASACVPAEQGPERWSAFLAPDLARLFADTPWLDFPPSDASQADVLAALQSASPSVFDEACRRLQRPAGGVPLAAQPTAAALQAAAVHTRAPGTAQAEAEAFLLQVMRDAAMEMPWRLQAAHSLLTARP